MKTDQAAQTQRAVVAEQVADHLFRPKTATPHHHYTIFQNKEPTPAPIVPAVPVPVGPSAAEVRESILLERQRGQRLHEELSKNMASVQQQMAEQIQRAKASETSAWTAQMQSEVRAGKAEARAQAAAVQRKPDKLEKMSSDNAALNKTISPIRTSARSRLQSPERLNRRLERFRRFNENAAQEGLIPHLRILLLKLNEKQVLSGQTRKRTMGQLRKLLSHPSKNQKPVLLPVRSRKLF